MNSMIITVISLCINIYALTLLRNNVLVEFIDNVRSIVTILYYLLNMIVIIIQLSKSSKNGN